MKNELIMNKAVELKEHSLPLSELDFKNELDKNCFVIWSLPNFQKYTLAKTPFLYEHISSVEHENLDLHAAYLAAHLKANLWPVVYQGENNGHLIRHVCPFKESTNEISSQGGKFDFFPHVDNPDLKITGEPKDIDLGDCPETLSLLCLRKQDNVNTSLLKLDDIVAQPLPEEVEMLQEPVFRVNRPDSFNKKTYVDNVPILSFYNGKWYSRFDWHNVNALNEKGNKALEHMKSLTLDKKFWFDVPLSPGML